MSTTTTRTDELTDAELEILEFARLQWRYAGARDQAIRDRFDITAIAYDQKLVALLDRPAALRAHPMLVRRLQRLRDQRRSGRAAR